MLYPIFYNWVKQNTAAKVTIATVETIPIHDAGSMCPENDFLQDNLCSSTFVDMIIIFYSM